MAEQERIVAAIEEQFSRLDAGSRHWSETTELKRMGLRFCRKPKSMSAERQLTTLEVPLEVQEQQGKIAYVLVPGDHIEWGAFAPGW